MLGDVRIAIVGAGFSGLGMAVRLKQAGVEDFVVLERAGDVGGTWRANTYPGCQCDVPSHLYSLSFAPNPGWSRTYSLQPEIWEYLRGVADREGLHEHLRLGHDVTAATWSEDEQRWELETSQGPLRAQVLIGALGPLTRPSVPGIPGLDAFEGKVFHSAEWDHDHDLTGERVAVVGTGASAIQFVPRIQRQVARMHLFQRTPPWILPHSDRPISRPERLLYRALPFTQRLVRAAIYWSREAFVIGFAKDQRFMRPAERLARWHLRRQVRDPRLREALTPSFRLGCKRILISNHYYPALAQPNVEVVTDGIREVRGNAVVSHDGTRREVDTIILGTGFHVTDPPAAKLLRGRDGRTLDEVSGGSPQAYLGAAVAGFPNLFMLIGPNTGLGHNSMVFMIESQLNYVLDALRHMGERRVTSFDVRPEVQAAYNEELQERMPGTVWLSGCASWYLDAEGRNTTIWPDFTFRFRQRTRRFDPAEYELRMGVGEPVPAAA